MVRKATGVVRFWFLDGSPIVSRYSWRAVSTLSPARWQRTEPKEGWPELDHRAATSRRARARRRDCGHDRGSPPRCGRVALGRPRSGHRGPACVDVRRRSGWGTRVHGGVVERPGGRSRRHRPAGRSRRVARRVAPTPEIHGRAAGRLAWFSPPDAVRALPALPHRSSRRRA